MTRGQTIAEMRHLASHCDAWPHATVSEWNAAINAAIERQLIAETDGVLRVPVAVEQPVKKSQMELF